MVLELRKEIVKLFELMVIRKEMGIFYYFLIVLIVKNICFEFAFAW